MAPVTLRQFEDITPPALTALLHDAGILSAGTVTGLEIEPIGAGVGFLGQVARLRPSYDRAPQGAPRTLIGSCRRSIPAVAKSADCFNSTSERSDSIAS